MFWYILTFIGGVYVGIGVMCVFAVAKHEDDLEERAWHNIHNKKPRR